MGVSMYVLFMRDVALIISVLVPKSWCYGNENREYIMSDKSVIKRTLVDSIGLEFGVYT